MPISIPLIVAGAALIMALLERFPILVWAGAALLGWIVGETIATDPVISAYLLPRLGPEGYHYVTLFAALAGAILVLIVGGMWRRSNRVRHKTPRSTRRKKRCPRQNRGAMNEIVRGTHAPVRRIGASACPHDCPSTCALDVEILDGARIGRVHGAEDNSYTAGVICAKVARYAERVHHPDRLLQPLRRTGDKGAGEFEPISWDDALDLVAEASSAPSSGDGTRGRLALLLRRHDGPGDA